jgi:hypothetical protein
MKLNENEAIADAAGLVQIFVTIALDQSCVIALREPILQYFNNQT